MKNSIRVLLAGGVAVGTAMGVAACAPPASPPADLALTIAVDSLPIGNFDPAQGMLGLDSSFLLAAVQQPLFSWDGDGRPVPGLATEYTVNDDGTVVDITLRDDVTFPDGTHLDANVAEEFYDHLLASDAYLVKATAERFGAEFTATGEYTLQLTTESPVFHPDYMYYDLFRLVLFAPVLSPASIEDPERALTEPTGVGPYTIEEAVPDAEVTLVRNPDYWDTESYPYETIVLKLLTDPISRLNALKSGQVDAASLLPEQIAEAEASGLRIQSGSPTYYTLIVRDAASSTLEPLRDVRVRQAIMLAFDRESIAETVDLGYGRASSQAFIEGQAEYVEGGDERFGHDLDRARELMAEAGYAGGFDVTIPTIAADAGVRPIVEQSLADIGIRVTFEQLTDIGSHYVAIMGGEYPLNLFLMYNINTLRLLDEEFVGLGRVFDPNPRVSELLETIKHGADEASAEASAELGELLLDEAWYIPFSRPAQFWGSVADVEIDLNDAVPVMLFDIHPAG